MTIKTVEFPMCPACGGRGWRTDYSDPFELHYKHCHTCDGQQEVTQEQWDEYVESGHAVARMLIIQE